MILVTSSNHVDDRERVTQQQKILRRKLRDHEVKVVVVEFIVNLDENRTSHSSSTSSRNDIVDDDEATRQQLELLREQPHQHELDDDDYESNDQKLSVDHSSIDNRQRTVNDSGKERTHPDVYLSCSKFLRKLVASNVMQRAPSKVTSAINSTRIVDILTFILPKCQMFIFENRNATACVVSRRVTYSFRNCCLRPFLLLCRRLGG